jgi:hypothetical protein
MASATKLPIRDSVGAALRFVRENWRFVLIVAGIGAVVQGIAVALPSIFGAVLLAFAAACVYAALTYAALNNGPQGLQPRIARDGARVAASVGLLAFLLAIVFIMMMFVAMSILIGPYGAEVQAAGQDEQAITAIMNRAVEEQPATSFWIMVVSVAIMFALTSLFYVVAPATVDQQRIAFFESWRLTKGNLLGIMGARLLLLAPALILAGALQSLLAAALGAEGGSVVTVMQLAQSNPVAFALFGVFGSFLQIALYSSLEAGLSASIYKELKAPAAPPAV